MKSLSYSPWRLDLLATTTYSSYIDVVFLQVGIVVAVVEGVGSRVGAGFAGMKRMEEHALPVLPARGLTSRRFT